jgi:hypothetical protein
MRATPSLLRELRSLRGKFKEFIDKQDSALAAEKRIHKQRLKELDKEMELLKPLVACTQEIYGHATWEGMIFDSERRSRGERLSAIESESNNSAILMIFLRRTEQEMERALRL